MRLLSFLSLVQDILAVVRPADSIGWKRHVNYDTGAAAFWNPSLGLTLSVRDCVLPDGGHHLEAAWSGAEGALTRPLSFFSGSPNFDWQIAAEGVVDAMPEAAPARTASDRSAASDQAALA